MSANYDQTTFDKLVAMRHELETRLRELRDLDVWDEELERIEGVLQSLPDLTEPDHPRN
jgi:hypothetical protein